MLRVVVDPSSLVSYALTGNETMQRLVAHWRADDFVLLTSPSTRAELCDLLAWPSIRQLSALSLDELAPGVERFSHPVAGTLDLSGACRDPKEDRLLACAIEGGAHYLVSSAPDLLDMRRHQETCIVNPGQFLLALELHELPAEQIAARFAPETLHGVLNAMCLDPSTEAKLKQVLSQLQEVREHAAGHGIPRRGALRRLARQLRRLVLGR